MYDVCETYTEWLYMFMITAKDIVIFNVNHRSNKDKKCYEICLKYLEIYFK
jgi:hypothetical protein